MLKKLLVALVLGFAVPGGVTAVASFAFVPEAQAWSLKKAVKKVGRAAKKSGKAVGRNAKRNGKAVWRIGQRAGKAVGLDW